MHDTDLCIVGGGPVGATLALALRDGGWRTVVLDARAAGSTLRQERTLALSHGARLLLERLDVWCRLRQLREPTPITAVEVTERGRWGQTRLDAATEGLPALGYTVRYSALQAALDDALQAAGVAVEYGATVTAVRTAGAYTVVNTAAGTNWVARLAVLADGGSDLLPGLRRHGRDYGQTAIVAQVGVDRPAMGLASERFTPEGPIALLPNEGAYTLIWTLPPDLASRTAALSDNAFLAALGHAFGGRLGNFVEVGPRLRFPLKLAYMTTPVAPRVAILGNAAQTLHPIAGQGFNVGLRDAWQLAATLLDLPPGSDPGAADTLAVYARSRRWDRWGGIAFTDGLISTFSLRAPLAGPLRGAALTALDLLPPVKAAFSRAMMFGL